MRLFRSTVCGALAAFDMLDTRQYRSVQIGGPTLRSLPPQAYDPARTLTGAEQEKWLFDRLPRPAPRGTCWPSRSKWPRWT